jgi:hypothetical protein
MCTSLCDKHLQSAPLTASGTDIQSFMDVISLGRHIPGFAVY